MPDPGAAAALRLLALLASVGGMGALALSMPVHAQQVWGAVPSASILRTLRAGGFLALAAALAACLGADHASMAVLVWVMGMAAAALAVAFVLTARPRWLRLLALWVRTGNRERT